MQITRRQVIIALMALQVAGAALLAVGQISRDSSASLVIGAALLATAANAALLMAYLRGWEGARLLNVVLITATVALVTPEPFVTRFSALIVLVPASVALILGEPRWVLGVGLGMLGILTLRSGPAGGFMTAYTGDLRTLTSYVVIVVAMYLSRLLADSAQRVAERSAAQAEAARAEAEAQAQANAEQARELAEQNERQRRLLELVTTLETPAVALAEGVLLAPLVGALDDRRAAALTDRLLRAARERRARLVVIDVAGVPQADAATARSLLQTAQALKLLGCRVTITGIAPAVATTFLDSGVALDGVTVARTPQEALERV